MTSFFCSTRRGSSLDVGLVTSAPFAPVSPQVSVSSQLEGESSPCADVVVSAGVAPAVGLAPSAPISLESDEEDLFSAPILEFIPSSGVGCSLKEPEL